MVQTRGTLLDLRSVLIAVGVLVLGVALGFGVGYRYEQHDNATQESRAAATKAAGQQSNQSAATFGERTKAVLVECMARQGVRYPSADADLSKPPPGVTAAAFQKARDTCAGGILGVKPSP